MNNSRTFIISAKVALNDFATHELVAALKTRITKMSDTEKRAISKALPFKKMVKARDTSKANAIVSNIAEYFHISGDEVLNCLTRKRDEVYVRDWCMWFILKETTLTLKQIGEMFDRKDHTTVIHARDKVNGQLTALHMNPYREDYESLTAIAVNGIEKEMGRPEKTITSRRRELVNNVVSIEKRQIVPATYTNTNFEIELENKYKTLVG